jgi:hypothetical protein
VYLICKPESTKGRIVNVDRLKAYVTRDESRFPTHTGNPQNDLASSSNSESYQNVNDYVANGEDDQNNQNEDNSDQDTIIYDPMEELERLQIPVKVNVPNVTKRARRQVQKPRRYRDDAFDYDDE